MPVSRMRMRPWLEQMIDSESISGLRWIDKERTMFSIPWKHAARHGWEMNKDASLFKEWAKHTGKYVEGQNSDPKTWKANFRCAMNSLPDIEEVKDRSVNKGHGAVRVFKMLPVTPKSKDRKRVSKRRLSRPKYDDDTSDSDFVPSPTQASVPSPQDCSMDSTVKTEPTDAVYMNNNEVPHWSSLGSDFSRRFEVSPDHSMSQEDIDAVEIVDQLLRERIETISYSNNGFLYNDIQTVSRPNSVSSDPPSGDEVEELKYTDLNMDAYTTDFPFYFTDSPCLTIPQPSSASDVWRTMCL